MGMNTTDPLVQQEMGFDPAMMVQPGYMGNGIPYDPVAAQAAQQAMMVPGQPMDPAMQYPMLSPLEPGKLLTPGEMMERNMIAQAYGINATDPMVQQTVLGYDPAQIMTPGYYGTNTPVQPGMAAAAPGAAGAAAAAPAADAAPAAPALINL